MSISEMQWKELLSIPSVHSMTSYQKDIFRKMYHKILPTQHKLFICILSDDEVCLACNTQKHTFDHDSRTDCCKCRILYELHKNLCQHGVRISRNSNILKQLLLAKSRREKVYVSVLLTTYYTKRQTPRSQAIVATYIYQLRLV